MFLCSFFLHIFLGRTFFLRFIDEGVASATVSRICKAFYLNFGSSLFIFEERVSQIPASQLQLLPNDSCDSYLFTIHEMLFVELFEHVLHFFIRTNVTDSNLFELAERLLHSLIETNILRGELVLALCRHLVHDLEIFGIFRLSVARFDGFA